jgi:hypothetical protein
MVRAVAEQMTILGLWERTAPGEAPPEPLPPPPLPPVDPRQQDLLGGAQVLRGKLEDACIALDAPTVRALHAELLARFGSRRWAGRVPAWADGVAWLVEDEPAPRALSLGTDEVARARFPSAPGELIRLIRLSALRRAAQQLIAQGGAAASLPDGRPAGWLVLCGGDFALARALLSAACEAVGNENGLWLGYLGEAAWGMGDRFSALKAYCAASLVDPQRIDVEGVLCPPVLELLDSADELELTEPSQSWLAVLADLGTMHALEDRALQLPAEPTDVQRLAALLRTWRKDRASLDERAKIEAKRAMAKLAPPGLRELLRRL